MPSIYTPAFTSKATLRGRNASVADIGKRLEGEFTDGNGVVQSKKVRVAAGTDADDDEGIFHPANYHAVNNAVIYVVC